MGDTQAEVVGQTIPARKTDSGAKAYIEFLCPLLQLLRVHARRLQPEEISAMRGCVSDLRKILFDGFIHRFHTPAEFINKAGDVIIQIPFFDQPTHNGRGERVQSAGAIKKSAGDNALNDLRIGVQPSQPQTGSEDLRERTQGNDVSRINLRTERRGRSLSVTKELIDLICNDEEVMFFVQVREVERGVLSGGYVRWDFGRRE